MIIKFENVYKNFLKVVAKVKNRYYNKLTKEHLKSYLIIVFKRIRVKHLYNVEEV